MSLKCYSPFLVDSYLLGFKTFTYVSTHWKCKFVSSHFLEIVWGVSNSSLDLTVSPLWNHYNFIWIFDFWWDFEEMVSTFIQCFPSSTHLTSNRLTVFFIPVRNPIPPIILDNVCGFYLFCFTSYKLFFSYHYFLPFILGFRSLLVIYLCLRYNIFVWNFSIIFIWNKWVVTTYIVIVFLYFIWCSFFGSSWRVLFLYIL